MKKKLIWSSAIFLGVVLCMALMFYYSSQDGEQSNSLSRSLTEKTAAFMMNDFYSFDSGMQETVIFQLNMFVRKLAHFGIFFFMGAFIYGELCIWFKKYLVNCLITLGVCTVYAIFDEMHQSFTPGRAPLVKDIFIDSFGALMGAAACFVLICVIHFFRQKRSSSPPSAS